jgi:hypothetical protein
MRSPPARKSRWASARRSAVSRQAVSSSRFAARGNPATGAGGFCVMNTSARQRAPPPELMPPGGVARQG